MMTKVITPNRNPKKGFDDNLNLFFVQKSKKYNVKKIVNAVIKGQNIL